MQVSAFVPVVSVFGQLVLIHVMMELSISVIHPDVYANKIENMKLCHNSFVILILERLFVSLFAFSWNQNLVILHINDEPWQRSMNWCDSNILLT